MVAFVSEAGFSNVVTSKSEYEGKIRWKRRSGIQSDHKAGEFFSAYRSIHAVNK